MTSLTPKSASSSASRVHPARHWAARLALIVASLGSMATESYEPFTSAEFTSSTQSLTAASPAATQHVRIRISADKRVAQPIDLFLDVELSAQWKHDSSTAAPEPTIRARMSWLYVPSNTYQSPPSSDWSPPIKFTAHLSDPFHQTAARHLMDGSMLATSVEECESEQGCEWVIPLDAELLPQGFNGTVKVKWTVKVRAGVNNQSDYVDAGQVQFGDKVEGFTVRIMEEE